MIRCERARLGLEPTKTGNSVNVALIDFLSLAARCRVSARDCSDLFAKEEFRRLANEFESRADQLGRSVLPAAQAGWWLTQREQARGFEGDR